VVETLSEPLSIKVFFSKNLPAPHNNTERYLRDLLEEYASRGKQYFNYAFYNVSAEEGALTQKADENREEINPTLSQENRRIAVQLHPINLHITSLGVPKGSLQPERFPDGKQSKRFDEGRNLRRLDHSGVQGFVGGYPESARPQGSIQLRLWPDSAAQTESVAPT